MTDLTGGILLLSNQADRKCHTEPLPGVADFFISNG